ncbi:hypothetical protein COU89_02790 [Candidatus Roizmanbacteria bacterium CG10_big_fil_rev_8_21_14_0_10_45_7]|uniref:Glycosyltransferase 2-like domain-containing protein n=1 Tax=Candidatus Roizmanbacteria bacterium CG10_big_fil_rev_8_21_14_0_10_45_7 TaxID=1974854 RepID=A0A2M8KUE0_9BACT|nr:MAG: hypothetical protein COU89_02790 [Candidatus Roizmanbacteria bacterium CG10_big_fil_rev_8_21_14_0_10_45_7]
MYISVIIPAYNEEESIARVIDSLLNQTRVPDEILIINNNSIDKTKEIALSYQSKGVRMINEHEQGLAVARDRGFREAKGDIICRTDADSIIPSNWISAIGLFFANNPQTIALSGPISYIEPPLKYLGALPSLVYEWVVSHKLKHPVFIGPNMALRKGVFNKIKPCSHRLDIHEDIDLSQHLALIGDIRFVSGVHITTSGRRIINNPGDFAIRYSKMLHNNLLHKPTN